MNQPRFTRTDTATTMTCCVRLNIRASADVVWTLLTDAEDFPRWNPTISRMEGRIGEGERLRLHVPGTTRTFTPRVSGVIPAKRMVWSDGVVPIFKGVRIFSLGACSDGSTDFAMEERFSGVIFALAKSKMPNFRPIFEAFASSLRREAEGRAQESASFESTEASLC